MGRQRRDKSDDRQRRRQGRWLEPAERVVEVRRRVKQLCGQLGVLGLFEAMPAAMRDRFAGLPLVEPVLRFDASFPSVEALGGAYASLRRELRERFERAAVAFNVGDVLVRDYYAILRPLLATARNALQVLNSPVPGAMPPGYAGNDRVRAFCEEIEPLLAAMDTDEVNQRMWDALGQAVIVPLVERGRFDGRLPYATGAYADASDSWRLVITVHAAEAQTRTVRLPGGGQRPIHRLGTGNGWDELRWASWTRETVGQRWADEIGLRKDGEAWPVFAQGHALERMRQRLDVSAYGKVADHWLHESMSNPQVVGRMNGGDLLVAYEAQGRRLGYLVVTARDGLVAVRTFLFLTMAQTPEGAQLRKRLRLTQAEVEYLRLHELSCFTRTDLKDDPKLRKLLTECGCGHLFEMAEAEDAPQPAPPRRRGEKTPTTQRATTTTATKAGVTTTTTTQQPSFAAELRKYVRLAA